MAEPLLLARVLVIDDQQDVRTMIATILRRAGFDVVAVESAAAGLREIVGASFDFAIVDLFMPEMDGMKLIKLLRVRLPDLPIIAISGVMLKASGRTALDFLSMVPNLNRVVCLQKPFRARDLLSAVQSVLASAADEQLPGERPAGESAKGLTP